MVEKGDGDYFYTACLMCDAKDDNDLSNCMPLEIPDDILSCTIQNGNYYDKAGTVVNERAFFKSCPEKAKKCEQASGNDYYDYEGNVVSKDSSAYKNSCGCRTIIKDSKEKMYLVEQQDMLHLRLNQRVLHVVI